MSVACEIMTGIIRGATKPGEREFAMLTRSKDGTWEEWLRGVEKFSRLAFLVGLTPTELTRHT